MKLELVHLWGKKLVSKWPDIELSHVMFLFVLILSGANGFWLGGPIVKRDSSKLGSYIIFFNNSTQLGSSVHS